MPRTEPPVRVSTYAEIAALASAVRPTLAAAGVRFHRDSPLGNLVREAEALARDWEAGRSDGGMRRLVDAAHAHRIAQAVASIADEPDARECLRRIAGNDVDLSRRSPSQGKDAFAELDLLTFLRGRGIGAKLDEPDIVIPLLGGAYPIACKKVYSEKGVEAQMRKGVKQLAPFGGCGLVAFNLDDLVPADVLLRSRSPAEAGDFLAAVNQSFIDRNQARLQRFVADGGCDGVLVSTSVLTDLVDSRPRFNLYNVATVWTLQEATPAIHVRIAALARAVARPVDPPLLTIG